MHTKSFWNISFQWTSHDDLTEKYADTFHFKETFLVQKNSLNDKSSKLVFAIWQKTVSVEFCQSSNWSGGQTHEWILLKKIYYNTFYSI